MFWRASGAPDFPPKYQHTSSLARRRRHRTYAYANAIEH
jgi:hypothetical protein